MGHQALPALLFDLRRNGVPQGGAGRLRLVGKPEGAHPVEAHLVQEVQQALEGLLRLAGVAHDKGGAQGQVGDGPAHLLDGAIHPVQIGRSAHRAQDSRVRVLQGHVQVRQDLPFRGHELDEPVRDGSGKGVHDANPGDVGHFPDQTRQQLREAVL